MAELRLLAPIERTAKFEGGYTVDTGGPTNFGVTQSTYNDFLLRKGLPAKPVKDITEEEVTQIQNYDYFKKPKIDLLPSKVGSIVFDYGYNSGPTKAIKALQSIVGSKPDGQIGSETLSKTNEYIKVNGESALIKSILAEREGFLDTLIQKNPNKYKKFEKGWKNRLNSLREEFDISELNPFKVEEAHAAEEKPIPELRLLKSSEEQKNYNFNAPVEGYAGNIDLKNRPVINNPDGSFSTEKSFSFQDNNGKEVLVPSIVNGKELSQKDAINYYHKTGENLGIFNTPEEADAMAEKIHNRGYSKEPALRLLTKPRSDFLAKTKLAIDIGKTAIPKLFNLGDDRLDYSLAQPALKYAAMTKLEGMPEGEAVQKAETYSWADVIREANPEYYDTAQGTPGKTFLKNLPAEIGGEILEFGTKPSSYIFWGAMERLGPKVLEGTLRYIAVKNPKLYTTLTSDTKIPKGLQQAVNRIKGEVAGVKFRVKKAFGVEQPTELAPLRDAETLQMWKDEKITGPQVMRMLSPEGKKQWYAEELAKRVGVREPVDPFKPAPVSEVKASPVAGGLSAKVPPLVSKWLDKGVTIIARQTPIRITDPEAKIKDISGNVVDLPKGHEMTPYKLSNGKIWLHDGKNVVVESGQLQNLANKNLVLGEGGFARLGKDVKTDLINKGFTEKQLEKATPEAIQGIISKSLLPAQVSILESGELKVIDEEQPSAEGGKVEGITVYRGDTSKIDLKDYDVEKGIKDGKELGGAFAEGPGIYFTTKETTAKGYGQNISIVNIPKSANIITDESPMLSRGTINKMLKSVDSETLDVAYSNWAENKIEAKKLLTDAIMNAENPKEQLINIWADVFYHQQPDKFMELMKQHGIDGIKVVKEGQDHYVIYNRGLLSTPKEGVPTKEVTPEVKSEELRLLKKEPVEKPELALSDRKEAMIIWNEPGIVSRLMLDEKEFIKKYIDEGKSLKQIAKELGEDIEDTKNTEKWTYEHMQEIKEELRRESQEMEKLLGEDYADRKSELKSYLQEKLNPKLKEEGEYHNLKMLPWLWAKEGQRISGVRPDAIAAEMVGMGYPIEATEGDVIDLIETYFKKELEGQVEKVEAQYVKTKQVKLGRALGKVKKVKIEVPEVQVGRGTVLNTKTDTNRSKQIEILHDMPFTLLGNKSEVLARLTNALKNELTKDIEEVYDLFGGAKGYRVGLFQKLPADKYHLNELSDERNAYYQNVQDPQKVEIMKQTIKTMRQGLIDRIARAFEIPTEKYSPEELRKALNKWLTRGMNKERYEFARQIIQQYGDGLLNQAISDNFQSPESSAIYYFLQNTSVFGLSRDAKGYNWSQGVIRTSGEKSEIRDNMRRIESVDQQLNTELQRDKNIQVTKEDAWGMMDKMVADIQAGKINSKKTAVLVDPQYLNPTAVEGTYSVGGQDSVWEGHKENLEQHLLPLIKTGVKIIYTNNDDINLIRWLKGNKLPYNTEEAIGATALRGGRDEIISLINYELPKAYTRRISVDTGGVQPGEQQYLGEEITGESTTFREWLKNRERLGKSGIESTPELNKLKVKAHAIASAKQLLGDKGKPKPQYRVLAKGITGKSSTIDMTKEELDAFIYSLDRLPDPKNIGGKLVPPSISRTTELVTQGFFERKYGKPTPAKLFTSQARYAELLGVKELARPMEIGKQELDIEYAKLSNQIDRAVKKLKKVSPEKMAQLLNTYEDAPAELAGKDREVFNYFRSLTRDILERENEVRQLLGLDPIPTRQGYFRHIADVMVDEILAGKYPLPEGLKYWSEQTVGKKVYNPMEMRRKLRDDLLKHFSRDLGYVMKSMVNTGLKEVYLGIPKKIFNRELGALSKDKAVYDNLTLEEQKIYDAQMTMPAATKKWLIDYVNIVLSGRQTALDESVNNWVLDSPIKTIVNSILRPFGKHLSQRPMTNLISGISRFPIYGVMGGIRPKQLLRNKMQTLQNLALYGVKDTIKGYLPVAQDSTLNKLKTDSLFKKSYSGFEDMPAELRGKLEKAGLAPYQWTAISNVSQAMNSAYYWTADKIQNPKNKDLGWADPQRTYKEDKDFFYPSELETMLKEMEYGAHTTQFQYIGMGMPEIFRYKSLSGITRLQSWWMNHWFIFHREAATRFATGHTGYDTNLKIRPADRINYIKYIVLAGVILNALGYERSYLFGTAPTSLPPPAQLALGLYNYFVNQGDSSWEKKRRGEAEYMIKNSLKTFIPGYLSVKDAMAFLNGDKPLKEYLFYKKEQKKKTTGLRLLQ